MRHKPRTANASARGVAKSVETSPEHPARAPDLAVPMEKVMESGEPLRESPDPIHLDQTDAPPQAEEAVMEPMVESIAATPEAHTPETPTMESMERISPMEQSNDSPTEAVSDSVMAVGTVAENPAATTEFMSDMTDTLTATTNEMIAAATDVLPVMAQEDAGTADAISKSLTINPLQGMKKMMKSTEDFVAFGQANMEAFLKSSQIWATGLQDLTKQIATTAKTSFEDSVSTFKAISTAKSVKEAIDLQSSFAKTTLEKAMAESNKITDASIKLTEQALAPITARVTVAVETFGKTA